MNSKIIIINPFDEENGLNDGDIVHLGSLDSDISHGDLLTDYGVKVYGNTSIFGILSIGNYLTDVPVYFLTEGNDNIVFLNVSNFRVGKMGLLYLPSNVSDKQKMSLLKLATVLEDFRIEINYNLRVDDGIVDSDRDIICGDNLKEIGNSFSNQKKA